MSGAAAWSIIIYCNIEYCHKSNFWHFLLTIKPSNRPTTEAKTSGGDTLVPLCSLQMHTFGLIIRPKHQSHLRPLNNNNCNWLDMNLILRQNNCNLLLTQIQPSSQSNYLTYFLWGIRFRLQLLTILLLSVAQYFDSVQMPDVFSEQKIQMGSSKCSADFSKNLKSNNWKNWADRYIF